MPDPIVALNEQTTVEPWTRRAAPSPARPSAQVLDDVRDAARVARMIVLQGEAPEAFPALRQAVQIARQHGADLAIEADAQRLDATALKALAVELVIVPLHGGPHAHDARVGPGAFAATVAFLAATSRPRVRVRVGLGRPQDVFDAVQLAAPRAEVILLDGGVPGSHADNRAAAIEAAWRAASGSRCTLELLDADCAPDTLSGPLRPLDPTLRALRLDGGWLPGLSSGVLAPGAEAVERRILFALGMPPRDAEAAPPTDPELTGRARLVIPYLGDAILACATLPRLATALKARGLALTTDSVWHAPFNVHAAFGGASEGAFPDDNRTYEARRATAAKLSARFLEALDLSDADVILAPGWRAARALWEHPSRRVDARLIVIDLHLEDGLSSWSALGPSWFPLGQLQVISCFPAYVGTYLRAGVPADALRWLPYPIARATLPAVTRALDAPWLAAGNQRRDPDLLRTLAERLHGRPLHVLSAACPPLPARHQHLGTTSPAGLAAAVASAHVVVLPVTASSHDAAGITLAALAMAAGTPVVGSLAWGLIDHVPRGAGRLVVHDAAALAGALHELEDAHTWQRASDAARVAGAAGDVDAWADAITSGRWPLWPFRP